MNASVTSTAVRQRRPLWVRLLVGVALLLAGLVLLVVFFPWDVLRGPLNRYVSEKTGRHFEITRRLDVKVGRTTRVIADGIEFANPAWAVDRFLVRAEGAEVSVRLWPLLQRRIELPLVVLRKPELGLQVEPDGRRSWALDNDSSGKGTAPDIGALVVDDGSAHYVARHDGADIRVAFSLEPGAAGANAGAASTPAAGQAESRPAEAMPLRFKAEGTWQKEPFTASGRTGNVLALSAPLERPFPAELTANAAGTRLQASGTVASLNTLDGVDVGFNLQGRNLADLYQLVGVVLPGTPRYVVSGRLAKQKEVWHVRQIDGKLGNSDLRGQLAYDRRQSVPSLQGELSSRLLDFDDLAPLVGLPEPSRSATGAAARRQAPSTARAAKRDRAPRPPAGKVLPVARMDAGRLKAMNADVRYSAAKVTHTRQLPLDRMSFHVRVKNGALWLDPLDLGFAGGRLTGRLHLDGSVQPMLAEVKLDARSLELARIVPATQTSRASFGKIHGDIDLKGRGESVAQMLGSASGNFALLMGKGQISNILLEFAGLDGAEIIKFLMRGDATVGVRCAATAFDVQRGLMTARALVLDTTDTVIHGEGAISLAEESINVKLRPYPKDPSILSLRSPLNLGGTFADPKGMPDMGALAGRAGLAIALGAINPLLALAATVETGPGQDADCGAALREAAAPKSGGRVESAKGSEDGRPAGRALGAPASSRPGAHYPIGPGR